MKVIYLHHSGFIVQLEKSTLIFDAISNIPPHFLRKGRKNYFFVSHHHKDHFDQKIFSYGTDYDSHYILGKGVEREGGKNFHHIDPEQTLAIDDIKISAFDSTDRGVSFLIRAENKLIFHAGDLNWWDWTVEDRPKIVPADEEKQFKDIIQTIKTDLGVEKIDVAFVPVDNRLKDSATKGAVYFIQSLAPATLAPMHFWEDFSMVDAIGEANPNPSTQILTMTDRNQVILDI